MTELGVPQRWSMNIPALSYRHVWGFHSRVSFIHPPLRQPYDVFVIPGGTA